MASANQVIGVPVSGAHQNFEGLQCTPVVGKPNQLIDAPNCGSALEPSTQVRSHDWEWSTHQLIGTPSHKSTPE